MIDNTKGRLIRLARNSKLVYLGIGGVLASFRLELGKFFDDYP